MAKMTLRDQLFGSLYNDLLPEDLSKKRIRPFIKFILVSMLAAQVLYLGLFLGLLSEYITRDGMWPGFILSSLATFLPWLLVVRHYRKKERVRLRKVAARKAQHRAETEHRARLAYERANPRWNY